MSARCKELEEVARNELAVGSTQEKVAQFAHSRGWDYDYESRENAYFIRVPVTMKGNVEVHSVRLKVSLDAEKRVKSIIGNDSYLAP